MRYRYSVSPENQLLLRPPRLKSAIKLSGRFKIEKDNRLVYQLDSPFRLKRKISFSGTWRLDRNHDLELILGRTREQSAGDTLTLKGEIICADRGVLAFELKCLDNNGLLRAQVLELGITCFSDDKNRLAFLVKHTGSRRITLQCGWQVDKNLQIRYTYEKVDLKSGVKSKHTIIFEGFWQISSGNKLVYIFRHSSDSKFEFRALLETPTVYPQRDAVKYRIGIGLKQGMAGVNTVSLYGAWKLNRLLGLELVLDYGRGFFKAVEFGVAAAFSNENEARISLKSPQGEPLGITLILTRRFLKTKEAEAFLRLKAQGGNQGIDAGISLPF
jgi:hypothetical protein